MLETGKEYRLIHAGRHRYNKEVQTLTCRHALVALEDVLPYNSAQVWTFGPNGELRNGDGLYLSSGGCGKDVVLSRKGSTDIQRLWEVVPMGHHPFCYEIKVRGCDESLHASLNASVVSIEPRSFAEFNNAWYVMPVAKSVSSKDSAGESDDT
jgi:hypothetical protein